ncbi:MAG: WD40 repeat domain-containing protein [Puniceicoccales bacterium]|jgi:WD40 repeat protein|nr:WD40 repeat domain-containing protein [Puniceicoccales bacterium]
MRTLSRSRNHIAIPIIAALFAVFFLAGCEKTPEEHARIAKAGTNYKAAMTSVKALATANDQALLADVATNTSDPYIRQVALEKLTDAQLLAEVLKNMRGGELDRGIKSGNHPRSQIPLQNITGVDAQNIDTALEKITDPQVLTDIARNAASVYIRSEVALKTGDQPALTAFALDKTVHTSFRQATVGKLTDQAVLTAIIQNTAENSSIREAAVSGLTDQATIVAIARDAQNSPGIRVKAFQVLTDQSVLAEIIMSENDCEPGTKEWMFARDLACEAAKSMTDQTQLVSLAKNDKIDWLVRATLVGSLADQKLLEKFATDTKESQPVRSAAVEKLTDVRVLAGIATNDEDDAVRKLALSKLPDNEQSLLVDIIKNAANAESPLGAVEALKKLNDQRLLADVATTTTLRIIREEAIDKITDQFVLAALARPGGETDAEIRLLALWRLADKALLADIAKNDPAESVRNAAAAKLSTASITPAERAEQNVADLIKEGKVAVAVRGSSISKLYVTLKRMTPYPLQVLIPAGTYFVCDNSAAQNMVTTADVRIRLAQNAQTSSVPVACANQPKDIPTAHDSFVIGIPKNADELPKLMAVLGKKNIPYYTKQAAIWIVTDNASYSGLDSLRAVSQYDVRIPGVSYGSRAINEPEAAEAIRSCAEAGIDIKTKVIWRDCEKILAGLKAGELKSWLKKFSGLAVPAHKENVTALAISSDGKLLASGDDSGEVKLWSLPDGAFVKALDAHRDDVRCFAISPDGKWLVTTGNDDCYMKLWRLSDGKLVWDKSVKQQEVDNDDPFPYTKVKAATFGPDGKWFVTCDDDGFIKLWGLPDCTLIKTLERQMTAKENSPLSLHVLALNPDGTLLAADGENHTIKLWSLPDGKLIKTLEGHSAFLRFMSISSDGKQLVSGSNDNVVKVWSLPDGALLNTHERRQAWSATVSPDGSILAAITPPARNNSGERPEANLWHLPNGGPMLRMGSVDMANSAITPDNTLLITGDNKGNIKLWSLPDGKLIKTLESE